MRDLTASRDKGITKSGKKGSSSDPSDPSNPSSDEVVIPEWTQPNRMLHEFKKLGQVMTLLIDLFGP